jgi:hypothetical protein
MEGPNNSIDLSRKFGLEGYNDGDVAGSLYHLITSNGISTSTEPTLLPIKNNNPKCYALTHKSGVSCII